MKTETTKKIKALTESLPKLPFVQTAPDGTVFIPKMKRGERLPGAKLTEDGKNSSYQVQHSTITRMVNHKVNLLNAYRLRGDAGIDVYVASVYDAEKYYKTVADEKPAS